MKREEVLTRYLLSQTSLHDISSLHPSSSDLAANIVFHHLLQSESRVRTRVAEAVAAAPFRDTSTSDNANELMVEAVCRALDQRSEEMESLVEAERKKVAQAVKDIRETMAKRKGKENGIRAVKNLETKLGDIVEKVRSTK